MLLRGYNQEGEGVGGGLHPAAWFGRGRTVKGGLEWTLGVVYISYTTAIDKLTDDIAYLLSMYIYTYYYTYIVTCLS